MKQPFAVALSMVAIVAFGQAFLVEVTAAIFRHGWAAPYALSWLSTSFNLLLAAPRLALLYRGDGHAAASDAGDAAAPDAAAAPAAAWWRSLPQASVARELLAYVACFASVTAANVCYSVALVHMHPAVVASIFSTAPFFVAVLSHFLLGRPFYPLEGAAVVAAAAGIVMVSGPWNAPARAPPLFALLCACASPVCEAVFKVAFAKAFTDLGRAEVGFVIGKIAALNFVGGGLVLAVVYSAGLAPLPWGAGMSMPWLLLAVKVVGSVAFNFALGYGVTVTFPLLISGGSVVATVLMVVADGLLRGTWPHAIGYGGMAVITAAFACLVVNHLLFEVSAIAVHVASDSDADPDAPKALLDRTGDAIA
jgi:drug/metabolite transporter (DMT)-like permease